MAKVDRKNAKVDERKKTSIFIVPHFQFKIISLAFFSSLGTVAAPSWAFYRLIDNQFGRVLELSQLSPENKADVINNLTISFGYWLLLCGVFSIPMLVFAVIYSHRIAGPIYQLNKVLEQFVAGKSDARVHFREGDEFTFLGNKINQVLEMAAKSEKK